MLNNIIGNSINSNRGGSTRYFTTLDGTADYFTIPTVTLSGDFEINLKFSTTATPSFQMLLGGNGSNYMAVRNGNFTLRLGGGTVHVFTDATVNNGQFHNVVISRVGTTLNVTNNGNDLGDVTDSNTFVGAEIGAYAGGVFPFDGVIADVKITDAGTLIRNYPIDEDWDGTTTLIDYGADGSNGTAVSITSANAELFTLVGNDWLGAELMNQTFVPSANVTVVDNQNLQFRGVDTSFIYADAPINTYNGLVYKSISNISNYTSGEYTIQTLVSTGVIPVSGESTSQEVIFTQTASSTSYRVNRHPSTIFNSDVYLSLKRILQAP